jgi:8-oxo-dGTP diphosphatase
MRCCAIARCPPPRMLNSLAQSTTTSTNNISMRDAGVSPRPGPSPVDRAYQLGYFAAYRMMRAYWRVRRPVTHGALVVLWNRGEVLLVRNSYVPYYSAPGGYVNRHEDARDAAVRELKEELGISVAPERLHLALELTHPWENKLDHVKLFELELSERPVVSVDHREVVEAGWFTPERTRALSVFPPLQRVIDEHRV